MKKLFTVLFALMLGGTSISHAQVYLIPNAGVSLLEMNMKGSGLFYPVIPNARLTGGMGIQILLSNDYAIQPEINLLQKGYSINSPTEKGQYTASRLYSQVEIPVLLKRTFSEYNRGINWFVHAGPSVGYYLNGSYSNKLGDNAPQTGRIYFAPKPEGYKGTNSYVPENAVSRIDVGFQFGGGANIEKGPGVIVVDARYGFGVVDMFNRINNAGEKVGQSYGKSRGLALTVGYTIPIVNTTFEAKKYTKPGSNLRR